MRGFPRSVFAGATKMNYAQEAKITCKLHPTNEIDMYCYTCKEQLCSKCVKEKHRTHDWEILSKVAREKRLQIPNKCKELTDQFIPDIREYIEKLEASKNKMVQQNEVAIQRVNICKNRIIAATESLAEKTISLLCSENQEVNKEVTPVISAHAHTIGELEALVSYLDQNKTSLTDHGLLDLLEKLETKIEQIQKPNVEHLLGSSQFIEGRFDIKILEGLFGSIRRNAGTSVEPPEIIVCKQTSFSDKYENKQIRTVCAINESLAWIHKTSSTKNDLVTIEGKHILQVETGNIVADFKIDNDGNTLYTDFDGFSINVITSRREKTKIVDTAPLHPWGISTTRNGNLLVTLMEEDSYTPTSKNQRLVREMTVDGKVKRTYEIDKDTRKTLFNVPYRVCQNYNSDICVIDYKASCVAQMYILQEDGTVKYKYTGQKANSPANLTGVACDRNCNIIVSDCTNSQIDLLHHTGQLLKVLLTNKNGLMKPHSLSLLNDFLWIGCAEGKIEVFKYNTNST